MTEQQLALPHPQFIIVDAPRNNADPDAIVRDLTPLTALRTDCVEEVVFLKRWQKLHGGPVATFDRFWIENDFDYPKPFLLLQLRDHYHVPDEHACRLVSSFVTWLGTSAGRNYRAAVKDRAPQLQPTLRGDTSLSQAYLLEWALANRPFQERYNRAPRNTLTDALPDSLKTHLHHYYEVLERTAYLLGTDDGQKFIAGCERNIALKYKREREARLTSARRPATAARITGPAPNR